MTDDLRLLLRCARLYILCGLYDRAFDCIAEAIDTIEAQVTLIAQLVVATNPEAAKSLRFAAGLGKEGEA